MASSWPRWPSCALRTAFVPLSFVSESGIGNPSFARLAKLLGEGDENELAQPVYASARDTNLMKCPSWDEVGNKLLLAMNLRKFNESVLVAAVGTLPAAVTADFFPQTYAMPEEYEELPAAVSGERWIAKPSGSKNGKGAPSGTGDSLGHLTVFSLTALVRF